MWLMANLHNAHFNVNIKCKHWWCMANGYSFQCEYKMSILVADNYLGEICVYAYRCLCAFHCPLLGWSEQLKM